MASHVGKTRPVQIITAQLKVQGQVLQFKNHKYCSEGDISICLAHIYKFQACMSSTTFINHRCSNIYNLEEKSRERLNKQAILPTFPSFETKLVKLKTKLNPFPFFTILSRPLMKDGCSYILAVCIIQNRTHFLQIKPLKQSIFFQLLHHVLQIRNPVKIVMSLHSFVPHTQ